jgi:hypothetical protein
MFVESLGTYLQPHGVVTHFKVIQDTAPVTVAGRQPTETRPACAYFIGHWE